MSKKMTVAQAFISVHDALHMICIAFASNRPDTVLCFFCKGELSVTYAGGESRLEHTGHTKDCICTEDEPT